MIKILNIVLIGVVAATLFMASPVHAQGKYPDGIRGLTPFAPEANYMSLPGYLRHRYMLESGRWISREEAVEAVRQQGVPVNTEFR